MSRPARWRGRPICHLPAAHGRSIRSHRAGRAVGDRCARKWARAASPSPTASSGRSRKWVSAPASASAVGGMATRGGRGFLRAGSMPPGSRWRARPRAPCKACRAARGRPWHLLRRRLGRHRPSTSVRRSRRGAARIGFRRSAAWPSPSASASSAPASWPSPMISNSIPESAPRRRIAPAIRSMPWSGIRVPTNSTFIGLAGTRGFGGGGEERANIDRERQCMNRSA